jgi:hypothetical protein
VIGGQKVFAFTVAALRNDVGMLAKQQNILDRSGFARGDDALLQRPRFGVADQVQVDNQAVIQHNSVFFAGRSSAAPCKLDLKR